MFAAGAIDRLRLGPPWVLIVLLLIGPGALSVGVSAAAAAAHVCSGPWWGRALIFVVELPLIFFVWSQAYGSLVTGWR